MASTCELELWRRFLTLHQKSDPPLKHITIQEEVALNTFEEHLKFLLTYSSSNCCIIVSFDSKKSSGCSLCQLRLWGSSYGLYIRFLRSQSGNDLNIDCICRLSKQTYFTPIKKKIKSKNTVKIYMHNIFNYHGVPLYMVSDWNPRTPSIFSTACLRKYILSYSFHPLTEGH